MEITTTDEKLMSKALHEAQAAFKEDEVPVGAIILYQGKVISQARNQIEKLKDITAHAEILAITQAEKYLGTKWLKGCKMYVTLEPCTMCAGALILSRIDEVVFGANDDKTGAFGSKLNLNQLKLNHRIKISKGVLKDKCGKLLSEFFRKKRDRKGDRYAG